MITKIFPQELEQKHDVVDVEFLVNGAPWSRAALYERGLLFRHVTFGDWKPAERIFQGIKRGTRQFYNMFGKPDSKTAM